MNFILTYLIFFSTPSPLFVKGHFNHDYACEREDYLQVIEMRRLQSSSLFKYSDQRLDNVLHSD